MRSLCVFCGSSPGASPRFAGAAREVGTLLARRGVRVVFGGSRLGLMGEVADAALRAGGEVVGVIPRAIRDREVAHDGLTELRVVESMHERKAVMAELSDAFLALPGGVGTMEELFEVWSWGLLGLHAKPYGLLDVDGYYRPLIDFLDGMVERGFLGRPQREAVLVGDDPERLLDRLATARAPSVRRAIGPGQT